MWYLSFFRTPFQRSQCQVFCLLFQRHKWTLPSHDSMQGKSKMKVRYVNHADSAQVFQEPRISKKILEVPLVTRNAEIKRPVTLLSKWLPRVLGEGPLLKKQTLWLSMRQPVPPHVHTNKHMHALMSQMRKKHWLTSVRGKFGHKNPIQ